MENPNKNEKDFFKLARFSTALSFAVMGAVLVSIRVMPHVTLRLSVWSIIALGAGAAIGWYLWEIPRRSVERKKREERLAAKPSGME